MPLPIITEQLPERYPHRACVLASCERGQVSVPWQEWLTPEENHARGATALVRVLNLSGALKPRDTYPHARTYIFITTEEPTHV